LTNKNKNLVWEENQDRHAALIRRFEKARASKASFSGEQVRAVHNNIVSKVENLQSKAKATAIEQVKANNMLSRLEKFREQNNITDKNQTTTANETALSRDLQQKSTKAIEVPVNTKADALKNIIQEKDLSQNTSGRIKDKKIRPEKQTRKTKKSIFHKFFRSKFFRSKLFIFKLFCSKLFNSKATNSKTECATIENTKTAAVKYPIAFKLVTIVAVLLVISLSAITFLVSILVSADVQLTAEDNNYSTNIRTAEAIEMQLDTIRSSALSLISDIYIAKNKNAINQAANFFFTQHRNTIAVALNGNDTNLLLYPDDSLQNIDSTLFSLWESGETEAIENAKGGSTVLLNASATFNQPVLVMLLPFKDDIVSIFFSTESMIPLVDGGMDTSFLLNNQGDVLIHPDISMILGNVNLGKIQFVESALFNTKKTDEKKTQTSYIDEDGNEYFGNFQHILNKNAALFTIIKKADVLSGIAKTTRRNIIISAIVLILSILSMFIFSKTISRPLKAITHAARKIENGDYTIKLTHRSLDEIGALTKSFIGMGNGLENFEKFTNKAVVRLARQGKLSRTGTNKDITICFVLIRDFAEIFDKMNETQLVDFVNEYLEGMVPCVTHTGGIVDKFLTQDGVVIMALWGAIDEDSSQKENAYNCVSSSLIMRAVLLAFNKKLYQKFWGYSPLIKMGCGINSGKVVVGQIGSEQRMEYTVIGDAVNLAARIDGPNDLFDTDILISENTYELVKEKFICEEMPKIEVKGKEKPLRIFHVINFKNTDDIIDMYKLINKINKERSAPPTQKTGV
jgi:adenylate cyclase